MDISSCVQEIRILGDRFATIATRERVTHEAVTPVEMSGIRAVQTVGEFVEIGRGNPKDEMYVIGHQHIRKKLRRVFSSALGQQLQVPEVIRAIKEDIPPVVPSRVDVVDPARHDDPRFSSHRFPP